jgi:hypothetical protein
MSESESVSQSRSISRSIPTLIPIPTPIYQLENFQSFSCTWVRHRPVNYCSENADLRPPTSDLDVGVGIGIGIEECVRTNPIPTSNIFMRHRVYSMRKRSCPRDSCFCQRPTAKPLM